MSEPKRRIFVNVDLLGDLDRLARNETEHFLGQPSRVPLYVMMNLQNPARSMMDVEFGVEDDSLDEQEMKELFTDRDGEIIDHLQNNPDLFRATPFELEDGSEAIAFELANPQVYTLHRVKDEADWHRVVRTYDPTWLIGPAVLKSRPFSLRRKKIRPKI